MSTPCGCNVALEPGTSPHVEPGNFAFCGACTALYLYDAARVPRLVSPEAFVALGAETRAELVAWRAVIRRALSIVDGRATSTTRDKQMRAAAACLLIEQWQREGILR